MEPQCWLDLSHLFLQFNNISVIPAVLCFFPPFYISQSGECIPWLPCLLRHTHLWSGTSVTHLQTNGLYTYLYKVQSILMWNIEIDWWEFPHEKWYTVWYDQINAYCRLHMIQPLRYVFSHNAGYIWSSYDSDIG